MKFDAGTLIAIAAVLFFYLRLIILQRQKVKQIQRSERKIARKKGPSSRIAPAVGVTPVLITNKLLLAAGAVLMLSGAAMAGMPGLAEPIKAFWWLPVTLGIAVMSFGIH